jgi:hypothetical protein
LIAGQYELFVTEYAATNPGEDIAEVFAVFVTRADKPTGLSIKDKKVQMLYEYPDLVHLRTQIRTNLGDDGTRVQSLLPIPGQWKQKHKCKHAH